MSPEELKSLLGDRVVFVEEPENSARELKRLEEAYSMTTQEFLAHHSTPGTFPGEESVRREWLYQYEINKMATDEAGVAWEEEMKS